MCEKTQIWIELTSNFFNTIRFNVQDNTLKAYAFDLKKFTDFLRARNIKTPKRITSKLIMDHLCTMKQEGLSDTTIRRHYNTIDKFCQHLRTQKLIDHNPFDEIKRPRSANFSVKVPSLDDINKLLEVPDIRTEKGCRDKAILDLLYSSGLRVSELICLTLDDVKEGEVRVCRGKGDKTRTIPLTASAWLWIEEYVTSYRNAECPRAWLFLTDHDKKLCRESLTRTIKQYGQEVGIDISAHTLRHACATHLLEAGVDIRFLQTLLGHSNISITAKYATVTSASLGSIFNMKHPRDNATHNRV